MSSFSSRSKGAVFERTRGRAVEFYFNGAHPVRAVSTGRFRKIPFRVLVPILEHDFGWNSTRIHELYESYELAVQAWETIRLNWLTFHNASIHNLPQPSPLLGQPAES